MTGPLNPPTTDLVAQAWLRLAVPTARVGDAVPPADLALRTDGFIRTTAAGGAPNPYVPMREPVVAAECFVAPPEGSGVTKIPWNRAGSLASRVLQATFDPALQGRVIDLSSIGTYAPARVHTVTALDEPHRVEDDPDNFARYDLDLLFLWTQGA